MESTPQEDAEGQAIVQVLATVLERLVSANSHISSSHQEDTKFHAARAPAIGVLQYLERIQKYAACSKECFIFALIYIDRFIQRNHFVLTDLNVHRVVITAVLLAAKFFDDAYYNNAYYAKVGGVLTSEMNTLECEFLFKIDFSLRVVPEEFEKYSAELIAHSRAMGLNQHLMQPPRQVPALRTYSQAELDPLPVYPNATHHMTRHQESSVEAHYPIQALHQSMVEAMSQQQASAHQAESELDFVLPFPNLAQQVSMSDQQQAQALPAQNPSELNLVAAAPQDVSLYTNQALYVDLTTALRQHTHVAGQSHCDGLTGSSQQQARALSEAAHVNNMYYGTDLTNYYANGTGLPQTMPSPPLQPPVRANQDAQLPMGCGNAQNADYLAVASEALAYLNPHHRLQRHYYETAADASLNLHRDGQTMASSRPIAIMGHRHAATVVPM